MAKSQVVKIQQSFVVSWQSCNNDLLLTIIHYLPDVFSGTSVSTQHYVYVLASVLVLLSLSLGFCSFSLLLCRIFCLWKRYKASRKCPSDTPEESRIETPAVESQIDTQIGCCEKVHNYANQ